MTYRTVTSPGSTRRPSILPAALSTIGACLLLAACSSKSGSGDPPPATPGGPGSGGTATPGGGGSTPPPQTGGAPGATAGAGGVMMPVPGAGGAGGTAPPVVSPPGGPGPSMPPVTPPAVDAGPGAQPPPPGPGGPGVIMRGNDLKRTHANTFETILTPAKVTGDGFGKLYCKAVDGEIYGQILYLPQFDFGPKGKKNAIVVVTMRNQVYVMDADDRAAPPIWQKGYGAPIGPARVLSPGTCNPYLDVSQWVGILSTPAVDVASATMYFVARTGQFGNQQQRLYAVNLVDGSDRMPPVQINASMPGTGAGSVNGTLGFQSNRQNQRTALLLHDGIVYIAWASFCDAGPYHGWILGYDAKTLQQRVVFNTTPTGANGGIWMSGSGFAVDDDGTFYLTTGNGTADLGGGQNYSEAFLKLRRQGNTLQVQDWFIPKNYCFLENEDRDLGSGGVLLVPGTNLVLGGGKDGKIYVVDKTNMGKYSGPMGACMPGAPASPPGTDKVTQILSVTATSNPALAHHHSTPVYWKSTAGEFIYTWGEEDNLRQFRLENGRLSLFKMSTVRAPDKGPGGPGRTEGRYTMPGGTMTLSANGGQANSGILWATIPISLDANNAVVPGHMMAFDASDVSKKLWDSEDNAARDATDNYAKFNPPTVYNGKVFAPTFKNPEASNQFCVYGLLGQ
jgi:hypothetical protein